jgi:hypothetical protein
MTAEELRAIAQRMMDLPDEDGCLDEDGQAEYMELASILSSWVQDPRTTVLTAVEEIKERGTKMPKPAMRRYYLDVRLLTPEGRENTVARPVYGPFTDLALAEQAMAALAARSDVLEVRLRDPNA